VSSDEGPYLPFLYKDEDQTGVFKWLRRKLGAGPNDKAYDDEGNYLPRTNLGRGIACPLCTSAYLAVPLVVFVYLTSNDRKALGNPILFYLGIWGAQVYLENQTSDDQVSQAIQEVAESMDEDEN
jgi:hypothetical protein